MPDANTKFVAWKADLIRARLNRYRTVHKTGRNLLPISGVLERMKECALLDQSMFSAKGEVLIDDEWLRRFTVNQSGLLYRPIDALKLFLVDEGFLVEEELDNAQGDFGEMFALHGYLASATEAAKASIDHLSKISHLRFQSEFSGATFTLSFSKQDYNSDSLLYVEEHVVDAPETNPAAARSFGKSFRKGYAFFSTKLTVLHIYVRGRVVSDRISYIQVEPLSGKQLSLVRIGETLENEALVRKNGVREFDRVYATGEKK